MKTPENASRLNEIWAQPVTCRTAARDDSRGRHGGIRADEFRRPSIGNGGRRASLGEHC